MFLIFGSAIEQSWNRQLGGVENYEHLRHDHPAYSVSVVYDDTIMKK